MASITTYDSIEKKRRCATILERMALMRTILQEQKEAWDAFQQENVSLAQELGGMGDHLEEGWFDSAGMDTRIAENKALIEQVQIASERGNMMALTRLKKQLAGA